MEIFLNNVKIPKNICKGILCVHLFLVEFGGKSAVLLCGTREKDVLVLKLFFGTVVMADGARCDRL